jgi:hypothetical protein
MLVESFTEPAPSRKEVKVAKLDLEFLSRPIERVTNDIAGLKEDDVTVVLARLDRVDATTHSLVTEVRAMHSRHERLSCRVDRIEEREHQPRDASTPLRAI